MQCHLDIHTATEKAYPALQHWSNIGALTSTQGNNVKPVIHPASGIQNMIATRCPGELMQAYRASLWQQGNTQQDFKGLHHQPESQADLTSAGFHFVHQGQKEQNFSRHLLKASDLNNNPGLQQGQHFNCGLSAGTSSAAFQRDGHGVAAQTLPLQDHCYSVPKSEEINNPLLHALLTERNSPALKFNTTPSTSSDKTNVHIELNTSTCILDERDCKTQQVKSSLAALNTGQMKTQNIHHSGGTHSTGKVSPVGEMLPATDDQIHDFIAKKLTHFGLIVNQNNRSHGNTHSNTVGDLRIMPSSMVAHPPATSASDKRDVKRRSVNSAVTEQCTSAVREALEEDSSKDSEANAELIPTSKETVDCATSASEEHSGTLVSAVGHSKHALKAESVEKSASVDFDLPGKKNMDITVPADDDDVYSHDCEDKTFVCGNDERFHSKGCDKYLPNEVTTLHYTLTALKELIFSLENVETIAGMDNISKAILQQYWNGDIDNINVFTSTEYPQIMEEVAATCTKKEDESPVILSAVSGRPFDELTEKQPSSMLSCSTWQEEFKCLWMNIDKTLGDNDQTAGVSRALKHDVTEEEKEDTIPKIVEAVGLDNVQDVADVSEDFQTKSISERKTFTPLIENQDPNTKNLKEKDQQHCSVSCDEAHSMQNSAIDKIQISNVVSIPTNESEWLPNQTRCEGAREDLGFVHSQMNLSIALSEEVKEQPCQSGGEDDEALQNPQYEDISDDELPANLPNAEREELSFQACFLQYEDISEDEDLQIVENVAAERPSLTKTPEPNIQQSFENGGSGHVQAQMETEVISDELIRKKRVSSKTETLDRAQHCSCPFYVETDDGFELALCPKCDSEKHLELQTNHSVSCSPSTVEEDEESDDQMDDDWIVIPLSISDLKFEPECEEEDGPEEAVLDVGEAVDKEPHCDTDPTHCELNWPTQKPAQASSASQLEVFDTMKSFMEAKSVQFNNTFEAASGWSTPEHEMDCEEETHTSQTKPELYSETEDSCDYSSGSEHNYMTVSRRFLNKRPAPLQPEEHIPAFEKQHVTDVQKDQTKGSDNLGYMEKLRRLIKAKAGSVQHKANRQKISKENDVTENHLSEKQTDLKRIHSSGSEDSDDDEFLKNRPPTATSSKKSPKKRHQEADVALGPNSLIPRLVVVKLSPLDDRLTLVKESREHMQGKNETPKTHTATRQTSEDCKENTGNLYRSKRGRFVSKPQPANDEHDATNKVLGRVAKHRRLSLPSQEGPSTSNGSSSSTSGPLPEARQSSASSRGLSQSGETPSFSSLPKSKPSTSIPGQHRSSSKLQRSHSYSALSAREHVTREWQITSYPTRLDRRRRSLRTRDCDSSRDARPGPSNYDRPTRQRHNSHELATPLMKKTKSDAREWTKAINRIPPSEKRCSVGEGYKWAEKPPVAKPTKGASMEW